MTPISQWGPFRLSPSSLSPSSHKEFDSPKLLITASFVFEHKGITFEHLRVRACQELEMDQYFNSCKIWHLKCRSLNPGRSIDDAVALLELGNPSSPDPLMILRRLQADYWKKKGNPEMTILYHLGLIEIDPTNHNAPDKFGTLKVGDR